MKIGPRISSTKYFKNKTLSSMNHFMYKRLSISFVLLLIVVYPFAQAINDPAIIYASSITSEKMKTHLTVIAADEMEGRETGQAGQRKAASYIENQFKSIGLLPAPSLTGYQQYYPYVYDSVITSELKIAGKKMNFNSDYFIPIQYCNSGSSNSRAIVFAGYGIDDPLYSDYDSIDVKGKTVLIIPGEPAKKGKSLITGTRESSEWATNLNKKKKAAFDRGAAAVLICDHRDEILYSLETSRKTRLYFMTKEMIDSVSIATAFISPGVFKTITGDQADKIFAASIALKPLNSFRIEKKMNVAYTFKKKTINLNPSNVIGIVEGSDKKDEYVFITAHYDHVGIIGGKIYNGADDDGSGTSAVLAMAEAFAKAKREGNGPRRTIVFMTVSGEEKGLWGSKYYSDHPVFPLEKTSVDLNIDMIGRIDTERTSSDTLNYVHVVGHDKISSELVLINESVNKTYTGLVLDYKFDDPYDPQQIFYRSDHYNFAKKGVPVLFFFDGMLEGDYHKHTDDIEKITWSLYEKRTRLIFHTAWEMANRNDMMKRDLPLPLMLR